MQALSLASSVFVDLRIMTRNSPLRLTGFREAWRNFGILASLVKLVTLQICAQLLQGQMQKKGCMSHPISPYFYN